MRVTIHQPDFLPWLGFFERWKSSDLFIILDDVQFIRRGWHHRDKIKTSQGVKWLTVPVKKKGRFVQKINEVAIDRTPPWPDALVHSIHHAYAKAPHYAWLFPELKKFFCKGHHLLSDFNVDLMQYCASLLQITTPVVFSSSLNVSSTKSDRLVDLVKAVGGTEYLTGTGSRDYLEVEKFMQQGVSVKWQQFTVKQYPQLHGEFVGMLSVVDYLMMDGNPDLLAEKRHCGGA